MNSAQPNSRNARPETVSSASTKNSVLLRELGVPRGGSPHHASPFTPHPRLSLYLNQGLTSISPESPSKIPGQSSLLQANTGQRAFPHFLQPNTGYREGSEVLHGNFSVSHVSVLERSLPIFSVQVVPRSLRYLCGLLLNQESFLSPNLFVKLPTPPLPSDTEKPGNGPKFLSSGFLRVFPASNARPDTGRSLIKNRVTLSNTLPMLHPAGPSNNPSLVFFALVQSARRWHE